MSEISVPPKMTTPYEENRSGGGTAVASDGEYITWNWPGGGVPGGRVCAARRSENQSTALAGTGCAWALRQ